MTIQLDGLGRQLSELKAEPGTAEASDGPVFVDESGRRSKNFRRFGWLVAVGCAAFAAILVSSLLGGSSAAPWLPLTSQEQNKGADDGVDAPGATPSGATGASDVADPGATTGPTPGAGATGAAADAAGTSTSASTDPSASDTGVSPSATKPAGSTTTGGGSSPKPSASASVSKPPAGTTSSAPVEPPPASPDPTDAPVTDPTATQESSTP